MFLLRIIKYSNKEVFENRENITLMHIGDLEQKRLKL